MLLPVPAAVALFVAGSAFTRVFFAGGAFSVEDAMITGTVGLSGVDDAFAALGNPEQHAKILIDPGKV